MAKTLKACGRNARTLAASLAVVSLAACNFAPHYEKPQLTSPTPSAYKEMGPWTPAVPADDAPRNTWWLAYGDKRLNDLETQLISGNPDLAAALHRYDEARAYESQAAAAQYPQIGAEGYSTANKQSQNRPLRLPTGKNYYGDNLAGGTASYEVDIWGRVRNMVAAGKAEAQASKADIGTVRLMLQAELADDYLNLRGLDAQEDLLRRTVVDYQEALNLTEDRYHGGADPELYVEEAKTQLQTAEAQETDVKAQRALMEHAIAVLVGVPASSFSLAATTTLPPPITVPVSTPSVLLERRPDVAAAERRVFAANRQIGVTRAAFFPSIALTAGGGFENAGGNNLLAASNSFWTLGPSLAVSVFDGGYRRARVNESKALLNQAADAYKSIVLTAFQEVEDNLALCNDLAVEAKQQDEAVVSARNSESLALFRYEQGATTYLDVITAQNFELTAERADIEVATRRLVASVDLVRALGGDWQGMSEKVPAHT
ncbi:MAG TPA: efflux transporter outer membrane subunit [Caulobacteraceae bacterium]|jgi:NodT family efflux transporter outer membrane factor (OMF) lipoprotein